MAGLNACGSTPSSLFKNGAFSGMVVNIMLPEIMSMAFDRPNTWISAACKQTRKIWQSLEVARNQSEVAKRNRHHRNIEDVSPESCCDETQTCHMPYYISLRKLSGRRSWWHTSCAGKCSVWRTIRFGKGQLNLTNNSPYSNIGSSFQIQAQHCHI